MLRDENEQLPALDAFLPFHESLGATEPPACLRGFPSEEEDETEPESAPCAARLLGLLHVSVMGTLEVAIKVRFATSQIGGHRQKLEIGCGQRTRLIRVC